MEIRVRRGSCFRGLTLVELIIVMIAMLIMGTFVWKTATTTLDWANNSRVSIEISEMARALEEFHAHFGDYPPDFHDQMLVWKFLKAKFPKCPHEKYPCFAKHSSASALCFWLGGPEGNGFSANPANPFDDGKRRIGPFFKFDKQRVKTDEGVSQFFPPRSKKDGLPYIYFRADGKGRDAKGYVGHPGWSTARPYRNSLTGNWIAPEKYQILCPGNDGVFGSGFHFPAGNDYDEANMDDMTSFSQGKTLKSQIPKLFKEKSDKEEDEKLPL
jgi:Tfp pilus assembly protein PilE